MILCKVQTIKEKKSKVQSEVTSVINVSLLLSQQDYDRKASLEMAVISHEESVSLYTYSTAVFSSILNQFPRGGQLIAHIMKYNTNGVKDGQLTDTC